MHVLPKGTCWKGDACAYSHAAEVTQGEKSTKPVDGEASKPCWHFQNKGSCKFGDQCKKSHGQPLVPVTKAKAKAKAKVAAARVVAAAAAAEVKAE